jgi:CRP-like cAMP-binding protein
MTRAAILKKVGLLSTLTGARLREIEELARELAVPARHALFAQREDADAMFIVLSGRVKIYSNSTGRKKKTFAYLGPGDFFGEMALIEGTTRTASAQAVEDSRLLVIRKRDFQQLLERDPALVRYLLKAVCARLRHANEEIEGLLFRNVLGRVAKAVLSLARRSGEKWNGGLAFKQRYTQQELAEYVGTTREPLARALSSLRRAGLVAATPDGRYAVPDAAKLAALCSND